jgi:superfamily I DNA/RNA helicase
LTVPLHPIVQMMAPSSEQEPAITARDRDVVVTAGAGTGKTRTLVARYLSLLADGLPLRSIVAITFTEKAAREMRNRVREQMRQYLAAGPVDAARWEDLYQELDAARISTIHGLCAEILRAHPAEAGLDPRFDVLDEAQSRLLMSAALDEALAWPARPGRRRCSRSWVSATCATRSTGCSAGGWRRKRHGRSCRLMRLAWPRSGTRRWPSDRPRC